MSRNLMTDDTRSGPDLGRRLADIVEEAARLILPLRRSGLTEQAKADKRALG